MPSRDRYRPFPWPLPFPQIDALVDQFALTNQGALLTTLATVYRRPVPAVVGMGVNGWDVERNDWGEPVEHHVPCDEAGHGGGDARMLRDLFVGDEADTLGRKADHTAGVAAVSVGIAAAESYRTGAAVLVSSALSPRGLGSRRSIWWAAAAAVGGTALLLISALVVKREGMRGGSNSGRSRH